jgi:hypothetical protein
VVVQGTPATLPFLDCSAAVRCFRVLVRGCVGGEGKGGGREMCVFVLFFGGGTGNSAKPSQATDRVCERWAVCCVVLDRCNHSIKLTVYIARDKQEGGYLELRYVRITPSSRGILRPADPIYEGITATGMVRLR